MIIWGGIVPSNIDPALFTNTGGKYDPSTDNWTATTMMRAPTGRELPTTVWTGSEMIVWGGYSYDGSDNYWNTGGRYNPGTDSWVTTSTTNAPDGREFHTAVWTGSAMIVWGGFDGGELFKHRREIQSGNKQLDSYQHHARTHRARYARGSMDRQ